MEKPFNRQSLKNLFSKGRRPDESNFASLIDSMVNRVDDGISKNIKDGLILSPEGDESSRLVSFYDNILDPAPKWGVSLDKNGKGGLGFQEIESDAEGQARLYFKKGGAIGVGTKDPKADFEVEGIAASVASMGSFRYGQFDANGQYHTIVDKMDGCHAFQITAQVGKEDTGHHALMHAHVLIAFGKPTIQMVQTSYGMWWNRWWNKWRYKIQLKVVGSTHDHQLLMKSSFDFGKGEYVKFHMKKLWDNDIQKLCEL